MVTLHPCQSYQSGHVCRDGFIQQPFCRDGRQGKSQPPCLRDELPDHWITSTGRPAFRMTDEYPEVEQVK